jgi:hypothetical protein
MLDIARAARFDDCTICTALGPEAVFTMRTYATNPHPSDPDSCTESNLKISNPQVTGLPNAPTSSTYTLNCEEPGKATTR